MKFQIKALLLLIVAATISTTACKKDDDKNSTEDNLTSADCWSQTKDELYDAASNTWIESPIDACTKDDCTQFKSDKTIAFDEGATKCDPSDPQTGTGTWSLSSDGKTLSFTQDAVTFSGEVIESSKTKLVLEIEFLGLRNRITFEAN